MHLTGDQLDDIHRIVQDLNEANRVTQYIQIQEPADEFHTMEELYHYRMLYNALAANNLPKDMAVKSWRHSDGKLCFGGGWFVVYLMLPTGQVSNHYQAHFWELFQIPHVDTAPEYDGHTPEEAAQRLEKYLNTSMKKEAPSLQYPPGVRSPNFTKLFGPDVMPVVKRQGDSNE